MHQELFRIWFDGKTVLINDIRVILVIPCFERALILKQEGAGVKWKARREYSFVNPKELVPPITKLVYFIRVTLILSYALSEGNPPI